ncbi:hypothetical protein [Fluviicola taffensis]|uniref:hypothetical protein n=1 Tax=Fluviicola taffensis TaxID=191579 RepID=UPI0031383483
MQRVFILFLLISLYSCKSDKEKNLLKEESVKEISLEKTNWYSQFYHYSNFYHFGMDGRGYSDDGQTAWSCPIDWKSKHIPGNKILYGGKEKFRYEIKKDTLTINYLNQDLNSRVFIYRKKYGNWIALNSYTYGSEVLKQGKRKEFFDERFEIQK